MSELKKISERNRDFFAAVYEVAGQIPRGCVTSYGAIARYLGTGKSARMVGWAMGASHKHPGNVPAHRVVNRLGVLTGKHHFGEENRMRHLLESEGVQVENDRVKDFDTLFWDPGKDPGLNPFD